MAVADSEAVSSFAAQSCTADSASKASDGAEAAPVHGGGGGPEASQQSDTAASETVRFEPGAHVQVVNLTDHLWMEGRTGTLVEEKWGGKWLVDLNEKDGKRSQFRKRWLVPGQNLQAATVPEVRHYEAAKPPEVKYYIVASWSNWELSKADHMSWDHERHCLYREIEIGSTGQESFQVIVGCDWKRCVHPSRAQDLDWKRCHEAAEAQAAMLAKTATPSSASTSVPRPTGIKLSFTGPDADSHGKNWNLGQGQEHGARYEFRMFLWEDETVSSIELELKVKPENQRAHLATEPRVGHYLVGTWVSWKAPSGVRMSWDESLNCLKGSVQLTTDGLERFQILLNRDWGKCIHPDKGGAGPDGRWELRGPDNQGHGKDWLVGQDGVRGTTYEVRLFCWRDESPAKLEIVRSVMPDLRFLVASEAPKTNYYLIGDFVDWKLEAAIPMEWDSMKHYFKAVIPIGGLAQQEFQILMNRDFRQCIHPDKSDVGLEEHWKLCGPDPRGHGRNWLIGNPGEANIARYEVHLWLLADGQPAAVRSLRL